MDRSALVRFRVFCPGQPGAKAWERETKRKFGLSTRLKAELQTPIPGTQRLVTTGLLSAKSIRFLLDF
jgi:hypothetical protein